jgi:hypothetical protein
VVLVLLLVCQAKQEPQVAVDSRAEIVVAHPQMEYLLALVRRGREGSLEIMVRREIIRTLAQEATVSITPPFGNAPVAAADVTFRFAIMIWV